MNYPSFVIAVAFIASLFIYSTNAVPNKVLSTKISTKDCPNFAGAFEFKVTNIAQSVNKNTYIFDGTLSHPDGAEAGKVSIGCQKSPFLSDTYLLGAGICTFEVQLIEDVNGLLGVVTAEGTTVFGFSNTGSRVTITGGYGCTLDSKGHLDMMKDKLIIYCLY